MKICAKMAKLFPDVREPCGTASPGLGLVSRVGGRLEQGVQRRLDTGGYFFTMRDTLQDGRRHVFALPGKERGQRAVKSKRAAAGLVLLFFLLAVTLAAGCGEVTEEETGGDAVALVNGEEIGREEFEFYMQQVKSIYEMQGVDLGGEEMEELLEGVEQQVLEELINQKLLLQVAEREGFFAAEEEIQTELEQLEQHFGGKEMLLEELEEMGMTAEDLKKDLQHQFMIQEYLDYYVEEVVSEKELEVTEEEIEKLYETYSEQQDMPELEEMESHLKEELEQQKMWEAMESLFHQFRDESEIEIFL